MITNLKYTNKENTLVTVSYDDGRIVNIPWPCFTYHREEIQVAITDGLEIEAFETDQEAAIAVLENQIKVIEETRDANLVAGFSLNGVLYHSDDRFLSELMLLIQGYQLGIFDDTVTQNIRSKENTIQVLSKTDVITLAASIGQYRQSVYQNSWTQKDAIRSQIDAILNPPAEPDPAP